MRFEELDVVLSHLSVVFPFDVLVCWLCVGQRTDSTLQPHPDRTTRPRSLRDPSSWVCRVA